MRRGGERYLDDLAWYLRAQGHSVDVIAGTAQSSSSASVGGGNEVRLHHLPNLVSHRLKVKLREPETFGARAWPQLVRNRYDVVHALVPSAALAARAAGQRVAFTLLGHPTDELMAMFPAKRRALRLTMRTAQAVTALSSRVADDVERQTGRRPDVIAPGVRTHEFGAHPRSSAPTVFFASAMRPEKGIDVLLRAFALLARRNESVRLVLSGPGDAAWAFDAVGADLDHCRDRIDDLGPGDPADLPRKYATAHVTVLPSRNEAFGLALAESLASGTPVVGCRGGGADDIVTDDIGRIVTHGDPVALASAIEECLGLAQHPAIAQRCIDRSQLWDWRASIGPQHEALYQRIRS